MRAGFSPLSLRERAMLRAAVEKNVSKKRVRCPLYVCVKHFQKQLDAAAH